MVSRKTVPTRSGSTYLNGSATKLATPPLVSTLWNIIWVFSGWFLKNIPNKIGLTWSKLIILISQSGWAVASCIILWKSNQLEDDPFPFKKWSLFWVSIFVHLFFGGGRGITSYPKGSMFGNYIFTYTFTIKGWPNVGFYIPYLHES